MLGAVALFPVLLECFLIILLCVEVPIDPEPCPLCRQGIADPAAARLWSLHPQRRRGVAALPKETVVRPPSLRGVLCYLGVEGLRECVLLARQGVGRSGQRHALRR